MVTLTNRSSVGRTAVVDATASKTENTTSQNFDEQLSLALTESLRRLGVEAGEVNISVRNTGGAAGRQIVITYGALTSGAAGSQTASASAPASTAWTNPFLPPPGTATSASAPPAPTAGVMSDTNWAPWDGPRDRRDQMPAGLGQLTASGAPDIKLNEPVGNQYKYTGPASTNPYFTTPSNPLRPGYVLGFANWFQDADILGGKTGPMPANRNYFATEEGANEALRLVREYEPEAKIVQVTWGGGPYSASSLMRYISLPGDRLMNAGGILAGYYHGGSGVTTSSDADLLRGMQTV